MRAPPRTVRLLPTSAQVRPPSTDLRTPTPGRESKALSPTPRPAYRTFGLLREIPSPPMLIGMGLPAGSFWRSISGVQLVPPSVVFQTPPFTEPTKSVLPVASLGSATTAVTRPDAFW